jgi:predicted transposase YbfD/YdcC
MQGIITILREVRDPRDFNARHDCAAMLFIALAATLCGAKSCVDIADFAAANADSLSELVELPHGAPSHDSFSRLFRLLDPAELGLALQRFSAALRQALGVGPASGVVAVDGKSLRRAYERGRSFMPAMMLSVWDAETRLSLAAQRVAGGDEIAATLAVLKSLALKGCIVTADALHCHPRMAEAVRACGADYAIGLKANNGPLYQAACAAFAAAEAAEAAEAKRRLDSHERHDRGHDRHERRRAAVIAAPRGVPAFPGLVAFGRIEAERRRAEGKLETATRYILLSKRLTPERLLEVTRAHWSVENDLHWQLDVTFHEDDARTRKDFGPENHAVIRRVALDILRAHPADKSIARKMKLAAWSKPFFYELFTHMQ